MSLRDRLVRLTEKRLLRLMYKRLPVTRGGIGDIQPHSRIGIGNDAGI